MGFKRNKEYSGDERPFNMALAILERCSSLFGKANEYAILGDNPTWARVLNAIKRSISFKLDTKEIKEIEDKIKDINGALINKDTPGEIEDKLDKLEMKIIKLMYANGLYYPKYANKTFEDTAMEEDV